MRFLFPRAAVGGAVLSGDSVNGPLDTAMVGAPAHDAPIDVVRLADRLRARITGEVRFDAGSRAVYSADASNYRQIPIGVVIPKSVEDIISAVDVCCEFGAPLLPRGGGTSQCGQCVNVAVVIDTSKYLDHVLEIDAAGKTARVEPGVVCDALRDAAEQHALTFGPDPATHSRCTLGGMIGNNSCGAHSVMAGKTAENIEALEILTYDGTRMWVGPTSDRELEQIIKKSPPGREKKKTPIQEEADDWVKNLVRKYQTRVQVKKGKKGGRIEIHYRSEDELIRLVDLLLSPSAIRL